MEKNLARVHIESQLPSDRFQQLIFSPGFTTDEGFTSLYTRKEDLAYFEIKSGGVALALLDNRTIVGFIECRTNEPNVCLKIENIFMVPIFRD